MTRAVSGWVRIEGPSEYDRGVREDVVMLSYRLGSFGSFLEGDRFPNLTALVCVDAGITDLRPLSALANCHSLYLVNCSGNRITSLEGVGDLGQIKYFYCNHNQIDDLSPLSGCISLALLEVVGNRLSSLRGLEFCVGLKTVKCGGNMIGREDWLREFLPGIALLTDTTH